MKHKTISILKIRFQLFIIIGFLSISFGQPLNNESGTCPAFQRKPISNYALNRNFQNTYQVDIAPHESVNCIEVPNGFLAELYASEETFGQVQATQAFAFDEKGRMWVVETFDYPNNVLPQFQGNDKIKIIEDTDGDGIADKETVFVDGLNIPQGITFTTEGVLVAASPHMVLFKDENGDDVADTKEGTTILTGFGRGDTHGGLGNLFYGIDNWIYFNMGYNTSTISGSNLNGNVSGVGLGPWRMRPDGSRIERVGRSGCNSWGAAQNEEGQIFYNSATCSKHTQHAVTPSRWEDLTQHGNAHHAITTDLNLGDLVGGYTAVTNHEIYTARYFPEEYWNKTSFVLDGTIHAAHLDFLTPKGSTWEANEQSGRYNILASTDAWTAPIMAKVGPDGALWIADWYNYLYLHNGSSPVGPGNAYIPSDTNIRDNQHARIYRVVVKGKTPDPIIDISGFTKLQLVDVLGHTNLLYRLHAQRLLIKKGIDAAVEAKLEGILKDYRNPDATGLDALALHAMWTLEGMGVYASNATKWDPILKELLLHPSLSVRQGVLKAMPATNNSAQAVRDQCLLNDDNAHVRLQALLALDRMPNVSNLQMWRDFRNTDTHSQSVYNDVGNIQESVSRPCTPQLNEVNVPIQRKEFIGKDYQLNFRIDKFGFIGIKGNPNVSGILTVYNILGTEIGKWNVKNGEVEKSAKLNRDQVLMYVFEPNSSRKQRGLILNYSK